MTPAEIAAEIEKSADARLDDALTRFRAFRRELFGDEAYRRALIQEAAMDRWVAQATPPAPPEVRRKLRRNWAWWRRLRGGPG